VKKNNLLMILLIIFLAFNSLIIIKSFKKESFEAVKTVKPINTQNKISEAVKLALEKAATQNPVNHQLRKFPFPYDAMLAISSDIDNATVEKFEEYHQFLNTKEQTSHGQGLGLDIGDSAWLYIGSDSSAKIDKEGHGIEYSMSYFQGLNSNCLKDADKIIHYYNVGWIDSLHTFGDFNRNDHTLKFTRNMAVEAWKAMNESGFKPKVWINHGTETNVQNFGAYNPKNLFKYHAGDDPKSPYYHTDLTIGNGIRYVWNSIGKSQFAYDNPLYPIKLRDGRQAWGFNRYTNDVTRGKMDWTWEAHLLPRQITKQRLDQLVQARKYSIVTQHLGKGTEDFPFNSADIESLQLLKTYQDEGKFLVARTVRLLDYARIHQFVRYSIAQVDGKKYINIYSIDDPVLGTSTPSMDEIRGLTFYVDDPENTYVLLDFNSILESEIQRNGPDRDGKKSIGVKWFKSDFTDYTRNL